MKFMRRTAGYTLLDHRGNEDILNNSKEQKVLFEKLIITQLVNIL